MLARVPSIFDEDFPMSASVGGHGRTSKPKYDRPARGAPKFIDYSLSPEDARKLLKAVQKLNRGRMNAPMYADVFHYLAGHNKDWDQAGMSRLKNHVKEFNTILVRLLGPGSTPLIDYTDGYMNERTSVGLMQIKQELFRRSGMTALKRR